VFHSIIGMPVNNPATAPWPPADPGAQLDVRFGCDVGFDPAG
jgi:hypothetical protein